MLVMPANTSGFMTGWLAGTFPGRIAWLLNCADWSGHPKPRREIPWALDNGAYGAFINGTVWDEEKFYKMANTPFSPKAIWVAVPDVVTNREATIANWKTHYPRLQNHTLAFCVQDGMSAQDVPIDASVVFVGGSTQWKWNTIRGWCSDFPRVHIGRVNSERLLWQAHECGAESCDGTGWFRGGDDVRTNPQLAGLVRYLEESTHGRKQMTLGL